MNEETRKTYAKMYNRYIHSGLSKTEFAEKQKNKNKVSQFKNSLKVYSKLSSKDEIEIDRIYSEKPNRRAIAKEQFNVARFLHSLNSNRNIKEKLPFRLSVLIGARINELANIEKRDITFLNDGRIKVFLRECKGGKTRTVVSIMQDRYVYNKLKEHIEKLKSTDKVFYCKNRLYQIAKKHGFKNHDLRKTCIQKIYYSCPEDKETCIKLIQAYLGHEPGNTYKYYTSRDINAYGTKLDI